MDPVQKERIMNKFKNLNLVSNDKEDDIDEYEYDDIPGLETLL